MIYILKHRAQHLLVWNNAPPYIRKPPNDRRLSPKRIKQSGIIGSHILNLVNLGTEWPWAVSFTPRPLYPSGKVQLKYPNWLSLGSAVIAKFQSSVVYIVK